MIDKLNDELYKIVIPTPFAVGPVNVYLMKGEKLTLVDVGPKTEEAWSTLTVGLAQLGYTPDDIEQIVITHHHPDHVGLIDYFPGVPIEGHWRNKLWLKQDEEFLNYHNRFFTELLRENGTPEKYLERGIDLTSTLKYSCNSELHREVSEGDTIDGLPGWKVFETPGHASSHIVLYHEQEGVMLGGDHILQKISSNPLLEPPIPAIDKERLKPLLQYRESLEKCIELKPTVVHSGHGDEVTNVASLLKMRLKQQEKRAAMVKRWISSEPMSAFEICQRLFPKVYDQQFALAISETFGQLDYLEANNEIKKKQMNNQIIFEVTS
ncbi:MBL fold metallo-hydrolase [Lottiidibacillus patelloidae]|uniref:MBL fold metallo-hydrolase n=1 Tax=Lottiidibacillus patelloidae TaxID=2670334 RepID=A0A263BY81_9BACI|nr:MBL fold metallo-hydrolase [Lottiidibacillus patelloidae]OZM58675.1 MBL fold metallo-hydrolase [Lottiidibacillus patelloidae]